VIEENQIGLAARDVFVRLGFLFVVLIAAVAVDAFRPQGDYSISLAKFDSSGEKPFQIRTPAEFPTSFSLHFDVLANRTNDRNVLQISGVSGTVLRFVAEPPNRLVVALFGIDPVPVTLSRTFTARRWHHVAINGVSGRYFDVTVDGAVTHFDMPAVRQLQSSAEIGSRDFSFHFGGIEIGYGDWWKPLHGKIANLAFSSHYVEVLPWPFALVCGVLVAGAVLWLLWPWLRRIRAPEVSRADCVVYVAIAAITALGFLAAALGVPDANWVVLLAIGAGSVGAVLIATRFNAQPLPRMAAAIVTFCIATLAAASLLTLPNWIVTMRMFERWPLVSAFCVTLALSAAAFILDASVERETPLSARSWLAYAPYAVFAFLALRTDSVFTPINALHWDYVLGPIRALREGGWLLWDVPSQYGFLNVLIPAVLPIHPAVNAFYWFQAAAFFAASSIFYRTLVRVLGVHWIVACVVVGAFFFLADPLLIGPTPYPSMSAVRFLWCYVLLALAASNFLGERPSVRRFARLGALPWVVALLWSAESAIYATVIFLTPLLVSLIFFRRGPATPRAVLRASIELIARPAVCALAAFGVVEAVYFVSFGHGPDWAMYVAYIRSYGAGFGEQPIPFFGPAWAVASILFGGAAAFAFLRRERAEGPAYAVATAMAAVWIVSSYYFGRAFPIIVTMLSPLLVFAAFTIVRAGSSFGKAPLMAAVSIPLLALGLVSSYWNVNAPSALSKMAAPDFNPWPHLPKVDPELASLLARAGITQATPVVYYDYWVAMPRALDGPYDRNWLPTPLQDLDDPIPHPVRDEIVTRFVTRHRLSGYLVQVTGEDNVPVLDAQPWITLLSSFYDVTEVAHSQNYRILQFTLRAPPR
jgi:hypothetical protein